MHAACMGGVHERVTMNGNGLHSEFQEREKVEGAGGSRGTSSSSRRRLVGGTRGRKGSRHGLVEAWGFLS